MSQKMRPEKFQIISSLYVLNCFKYFGIKNKTSDKTISSLHV